MTSPELNGQPPISGWFPREMGSNMFHATNKGRPLWVLRIAASSDFELTHAKEHGIGIGSSPVLYTQQQGEGEARRN
jgi:hypothetical protein